MDCSKLTAGLVAAECNKPAVAGAEGEVILINFQDIDKVNSEVENNVIESIAMNGSKKGMAFTTYGKSLDEAGVSFTKGTYRNSWTHTVPLRIFVKNEEAKQFVNEFGAGARVVAILKNKEAGGSGEVKYEAYGWDNGLELSEVTATLAMEEGVVYSMTIASSETAQEGTLPKSVFAEDAETTETLISALV